MSLQFIAYAPTRLAALILTKATCKLYMIGRKFCYY